MTTRNGSAVGRELLGKAQSILGAAHSRPRTHSASRFDEGTGTNPEELIGAAHARFFSMALSAGLSKAITPKRIETTARVHLGQVEGGFAIALIELDTTADVPGIDQKTFHGTRRRR